MSYDIYIGEAVIDCYEGGKFYVRVNNTANVDAPVFSNDEMTGNGNSRHPGYSQWSDWTRQVGLYSLFFEKETGLMSSHPGCFGLTPLHLANIQDALTKYRAKHPDAQPGWPRSEFSREPSGPDPDSAKNPILARLIWLEYWVRQAIEGCTRPAIYNS